MGILGAAFPQDNVPIKLRSPTFQLSMANPSLALQELDRVDAEESLLSYVRMMWSILEPGRQLVEGKVLDAICEHLEAIASGQIRKLLINVPPGCMKSMLTNVFFPTWMWGPKNRPDLRFIGASYVDALTIRDNRRSRQLIDSPLYKKCWGDRFFIVSDQDAKTKFENDKRGWKIATSVGGAIVGERGDVIIVDDPHNIKTMESEKIREATLSWFSEILPSRINDPDTACFIVIMQRLHERDISGLILATELGYDHLCLPMEYERDHPHLSRTTLNFVDWRKEEGELLWPERFHNRFLVDLKEQLRSWGGGYAEAGQLQQRPSPRGGGMFKKDWWNFFKTSASGFHLGRPKECTTRPAIDLPDRFDWQILTVDCSFKDTTTGSRVSMLILAGRGPNVFVLDNLTDTMTFKQTCDNIIKFEEYEGKDRDGNPIRIVTKKPIGGMLFKWKQVNKILIEDKANGPAVINSLNQLISGIIPVTPEGGKESRGNAIQPRVESGNVYLPEGAYWLSDFISELASFPVGAKDDQVDALSQGIIYMLPGSDVARAIAMANF